MRFTIETRRERHFRRMILLDTDGQEVAYALCDVVWCPDGGVMPWHPIVVTAQHAMSVAKIIIEQDPATDVFLVLDRAVTLKPGETLTITP